MPRRSLRTFVERSLLQPVLHSYFRVARGLTLGVRAAVIGADDRVFLVRHTYAGGWAFPGGGVEAGETAEQSLRRELDEEACIAVKGTPELHGVFFNDRVSRRDHVLVYVVRDFEVLAQKQPDREIAEAAFFPLDALPADTTPATKRRLQEIRTGGTPPATW